MKLIKEKMKDRNTKGYYRANIFGEEIIRDGIKYKCLTATGRKYMRYLYIFNLVKRNALAYIHENEIKPSKWVSSIHYNRDCDPIGRKIIGTDINQAYWDIAHKLGIITDKTHAHADNIKYKNILLASLASLGADKSWRNMEGTVGFNVTIIKGNDQLKEAYKKIRFTCFKYMRKLAKMLGNDFVCYKTDCIYYIHTKENIKLVEDFLRSKGLHFKPLMDFKQLREDEY